MLKAVVAVAALAAPLIQASSSSPLGQPAAQELSGIREAVTRYVVEELEPPCRNYWDGETYCLEFEGGKQPSAEFLTRLLPLGKSVYSVADCRERFGMEGQTIDPFIRIRSISQLTEDEATVDVMAFCSHGTPTVKRESGKWRIAGSPGGWVGCGPVPGDCAASGPRSQTKEPVLTDLLSRLRPVLERYYPGARTHVRGNLLEFEHDTRMFLIHIPLKTGEWQEAREMKGPNRGGILGTIELRDGRYDGAAVLPQTFDQRYFETLVLAEASPDGTRFLYVHLSYPRGVDGRFLGEFHDAVRSAWTNRR